MNSPARQGERGGGGGGGERKRESQEEEETDKGELLTRISLLQEKAREGSGR